jgi:hypothetical protein
MESGIMVKNRVIDGSRPIGKMLKSKGYSRA